MNLDSFLREELKVIDQEVLRGKTTFTFSNFSLNELTLFSATENVFFFESKDQRFSYLGLGKSCEFNLNGAKLYLESHPHHLVYQGYFEEAKLPMIYLPEWVFVKVDDTITLQIFHSQEFQSFSPSNLLFNPNVWESFLGPWVSYEESPDSDEWEKMINEAQRLFNKKELEKIVLSRKKIFNYGEKIELPVMFNSLYMANKTSSHFSIYHQINDQTAFVSLSPERLFTLKNNLLETVSLAGSAPRGTNEEEDELNEINLVNNERLIREHEIVTRDIEVKLKDLAFDLKVSPLVTMKLPYIFHRQANIKAVIHPGVTPLDLIGALHPTAAVGGLPSLKAKEKIREIEIGPREYYAAPVGVLSKSFSEIAVGIRSGLIDDQTLTVFGGAGIVSGCDASEEWRETGYKMQPFTKVINRGVI